MSSMNIALVAQYRKKELEDRIGVLLQKCQLAHDYMDKIEAEIATFPAALNCELSEFRECFLSLMKYLDERIYIIDEFNFSIENSGFHDELETSNNQTHEPLPLTVNPSFQRNTTHLPQTTTPLQQTMTPLQQETTALQQVPRFQPLTTNTQHVFPPFQQATTPQQRTTLLQQVGTPMFRQMQPPVQPFFPPFQFGTNSVQSATSNLQHATIPLQNLTTPLQHVTNPLQQVTNPLQQETNPLQQEANPLQQVPTLVKYVATNRLQHVTNPLQQETNPLQQETNPLQQVLTLVKYVATNPLQHVTNPLQQETNPLQQETNPLQQETNPLQQETNPLQQVPTLVKYVATNPLQHVTTPLQHVSTPLQHVTTPLQQVTTPLQPTSTPMHKYMEANAVKHGDNVKKEWKRNKREDCLLYFSSTSTSHDSIVPIPMQAVAENAKIRPEDLIEAFQNVSFSQADDVLLPAQEMLVVDESYSGFVIFADVPSLSIIVDKLDDLQELRVEMYNYYSNLTEIYDPKSFKETMYCAAYDDDTPDWYRVMLINFVENDQANVFYIDTGEEKTVGLRNIRPLCKQFAKHAPFARSCQLAEVDFHENDKELVARIQAYFDKLAGKFCTVKIEDNNSESLVVYLWLADDGRNVNKDIIDTIIRPQNERHAESSITSDHREGPHPDENENPEHKNECSNQGNEYSEDENDNPEYDDVLEAVTGYHNRDEAEICKFYKPGQDKCFKKFCTKKHIPFHPDGWTLDKVPCVANGEVLPLPKPGSWIQVKVTAVTHFNKIYVQFPNADGAFCNSFNAQHTFGSNGPPRTFNELVNLMNSPSVVYETSNISPAIGEVVAAKFLDQRWYRAVVLALSMKYRSVEVRYVDYGTQCWVEETAVSKLHPMFTVLPHQAVMCNIVDVKLINSDLDHIHAAKQALLSLIDGKTVNAKVISRSFDEMNVIIVSENGISYTDLVAEKLANVRRIAVTDASVEDDTKVICKYVVQ